MVSSITNKSNDPDDVFRVTETSLLVWTPQTRNPHSSIFSGSGIKFTTKVNHQCRLLRTGGGQPDPNVNLIAISQCQAFAKTVLF